MITPFVGDLYTEFLYIKITLSILNENYCRPYNIILLLLEAILVWLQSYITFFTICVCTDNANNQKSLTKKKKKLSSGLYAPFFPYRSFSQMCCSSWFLSETNYLLEQGERSASVERPALDHPSPSSSNNARKTTHVPLTNCFLCNASKSNACN